MRRAGGLALLHWRWVVLLLAALPQIGCSQRGQAPAPGLAKTAQELDPVEEAPGPGYFADVTASSGVDFCYRNGEEADLYAILESLGGGVALLDYDQDGLLDVFLTGGGSLDAAGKKILGCPCRLYKNLGGWKFKDVTTEAGLDRLAGGQPWFYNHGAAVADYDNDGWPDLLVTGYGRMALFRNNHGRFQEVTAAAGLLDRPGQGTHWSTSAAWGDLNGDGRPDLVVVHYLDWSLANHHACKLPGKPTDVCSPKEWEPVPTRLYLNNGDGTFREGSREAGLQPAKGLGVLILDLDEDGRPDIFVASDTTGNQLYLNKGGGRFEEAALPRGVAYSEQAAGAGSMGVDAADYNGSGHFSLFVTNYIHEAHALYRNDSGGWFRHASAQAGIMAIGFNFVGFGTAFVDFDHSGTEGIIITNGHVLRRPPPPQTTAQRPILFRNRCQAGDRSARSRFEDVSRQAGSFFQQKHRGRGLALGDLDNDGKLDVVISHCNEPVVLLRNTVENDNHWLGIELRGNPHRTVAGATLLLEASGKRLLRAVKGGGSYLSANDPRVVFGLGTATRAERLTVRWPSGKTQVWEGSQLGLDRYLLLVEGESQPRPLPDRDARPPAPAPVPGR